MGDPRAADSQNQQRSDGGSLPRGPPSTAPISPVKSAESRAKAEEQTKASPSPTNENSLGDSPPRSIIAEPTQAFMMKLAQTWKPTVSLPERGCVMVSGLVELEAPKAYLVFEVVSFWDPKTTQYDGKATVLRLKRVRPKYLAPLR
jgi:hypothetical protein